MEVQTGPKPLRQNPATEEPTRLGILRQQRRSPGIKPAMHIAILAVGLGLIGSAGVRTGHINPGGQMSSMSISIVGNLFRPNTDDIPPKLVAQNNDERGKIGIAITRISPDLIKSMSLKTERVDGLVVTKVWPNTSAERAGLLNGDIILSVDGIALMQTRDLVTKTEYTPIGENLQLVVERIRVIKSINASVGRCAARRQKVSDLCAR